MVCPRCRPIGSKVTRADGTRLGWVPEALYVGYLIARGFHKQPPKRCPACDSELEVRGQALVDFALILPILLFIILGAMEAGFLLITKAQQDRDTAVIAEWAVAHPGESWNSVANHLLPGCTVTVSTPTPDVVEAASRCQYHPKVLVGFPIFGGLPVSSQESAVKERAKPSAEPTASPSSSSTT